MRHHDITPYIKVTVDNTYTMYLRVISKVWNESCILNIAGTVLIDSLLGYCLFHLSTKHWGFLKRCVSTATINGTISASTTERIKIILLLQCIQKLLDLSCFSCYYINARRTPLLRRSKGGFRSSSVCCDARAFVSITRPQL